MSKLEEQVFNYLKQKAERNEIFSGKRAISPRDAIVPPKQDIDSTYLNKESLYNIERGDFSARPSSTSSITDDRKLLESVLVQKDFIQNDDLITVGDLGRVMFGMPEGLPEKGLTKSQKWLIDRLNNLGDVPMPRLTAAKRLVEFLSPFTNELINRTGKAADKLGEVPGEIQDIPSNILEIINESLESGTLKPIGDKKKRERIKKSFKKEPKTWI